MTAVVHAPNCPGRPGLRGICSCDKRAVAYEDAILAAILRRMLREDRSASLRGGRISIISSVHVNDLEQAAVARVLDDL